MFLLRDGDGGVVAVEVRIRDRFGARLRVDRIDAALAAGADPDARLDLALRARTLTSLRSRRGLAFGIQRVLDEVARPLITSKSRVPLDRARVMAAAGEFAELRRGLLAEGLVAVAGLAQTRMLLTAAFGPMYGRGHPESLAMVVRRAIDALDITNYSIV